MRHCLSCWLGCGLVVMVSSAASAQAPYSARTPHHPSRRPIQGGLTVGGQPIPESGPPASQP